MIPTSEIHYQVPTQHIDHLFLLGNAGETYDLLPVIQTCIKTNSNIRVLTFGVASELVKDKLPANLVLNFADLGVKTPIDKFTPRDKTLAATEAETIADLLPVKNLISGVHSLIEKQLIETYNRRGATTYAYMDNFSPNGPDPYFATALKVSSQAKFLLLTSQSMAEAEEFKYRPAAEKLVVGKPSMREWLRTFKAIDLALIRTKLNIPSEKSFVVTWIGGYGPDHKKAFELFARCIKNLPESDRPTKIILQQHPSANIAELDPYSYFDQNDPMIVPKEKKVTAAEASAVSDYVISYNSTAALQALLAGKKVFFVVPETDTYSNIAIDRGFVKKVSTCQDFAKALKEQPAISGDPWTQLGIPQETDESFKQGQDSISRFLHILGFFCCDIHPTSL